MHNPPMKKLITLAIISFSYFTANSQQIDTKLEYSKCLDSLQKLITGKEPASFKKAVFITENCYSRNKMEYALFERYINQLAKIANAWRQVNPIIDYHFADSINLQGNFSLFNVLKDTITFLDNYKDYKHLPFGYDFNDYEGLKQWSNMFVSKLLLTHSGNCHSLSYLYKILADELDATCWLSLAPNHIYIKNRCKRDGWYNTELTNGSFPTDGWIMASGYVSLQAVQNGIYMDTLSNQQSIALCVLDLAKGYEHQTKNYYDGFIIKCCDLALKYFPNYVQAILLKAETLKRVYEKQLKEKNAEANSTYAAMETLYVKLVDLGYREMSAKMYQDWLFGVQKEKRRMQKKMRPTG